MKSQLATKSGRRALFWGFVLPGKVPEFKETLHYPLGKLLSAY